MTMTTTVPPKLDDHSPYQVAAIIRQFAAAVDSQDLLALEIQNDARIHQLSADESAYTFLRRQAGTPRCELSSPGHDSYYAAADHDNGNADGRRPNPAPRCHRDAQILVTNGSNAADPSAVNITPTSMTRALCPQHATDNALSHQGWIHHARINTADPVTRNNINKLQLVRRLIRNLLSDNPAPYPQSNPFPEPTGYCTESSIESLRCMETKITYLLRPSALCAAPLCYAAHSSGSTKS